MNTSAPWIRLVALASILVAVLTGCAATDDETYSESNGTDDLGVGEVVGEQTSADPRTWTNALRCKDIPTVDALVDPEITVSLDGLTLHLRDRAGSYDRVFPIGVGTIASDGHSITPTSDNAPTGLFYTGRDTHEVRDGQYGYYYPCRIWWQDGSVRRPVFAGLPFIRLAGPPSASYGIHGPIDNFAAANGGSLRRGYVSHGCIRMSAEDVVEVYARIHGHARTPVRVQREVERNDAGRAVDLAQRWIGAECDQDADCNYTGGICRVSVGAANGTCSMACTRGCPDRDGANPTFCAREGTSSTVGYCMPAASTTWNNQCARFDDRLDYARLVSRPDGSARGDVCRPSA